MIKAAFFDLDGTLVSHKTHSIPQSAREALSLLSKKGIKVFTATGRHKATIDNIGDWQPDGFVVLNGGMCIVDDKIIFERHIAEEDIQSLLRYMENEENFPCVFLLENKLIMNYQDKNSEEVFRFLNFPLPTIGSLQEAAKQAVYELLAVNTQSQQDRLMPYIPNCDFTRSHPLYGDVIPRGSNKWIGIEKMLDYFDLKAEEIIAFGDGNNDIEMLQNAGIGIAMADASENLKSVADIVTDSVDEDGIWNALKKLGLI